MFPSPLKFQLMLLKVRNTCLLINIHEPFFVFLFSLQQDATETW